MHQPRAAWPGAESAKTFSNFIEGGSNRLARAMALAVSEKPGESCNPLYIYGGRGVGKSHLLGAIYNYSNQRGMRTTISFVSDSREKGRSAMSCYDMIIVDDLDFSEPHMIKELSDFAAGGGQLVISGASAPEKLPESQLKTMIITKGRSADIQMPEEELRIAIVMAKASIDEVALPEDAARFMAQHLRGNIQTLIGGYERVKAFSSLSGQTITLFSAIQALKDYLWFEEMQPGG